MTQIFENIPADAEKSFSICDAQIDRITYGSNTVRFFFANGFQRVENNELIRTKNAYIELGNCAVDNFSCVVFKRTATEKGAELYGQPLSLEEIGIMLSDDERKIEIYLELYDFNCIYWRGVLLPYNPVGLSDRIDIEISGQVSITYYWE